LRKFFVNKPLFIKLMLMFTVAAVIPIVIIAIFSYQRTRQQLLDVAYSNMNSSNQQINNNINTQFDIFRHVSASLYTDEILKAYLTQEYANDYSFIEAYRYIDNRMYSILAANGNISGIRIYVYNETIPSDGLFIDHVNSQHLSTQYLANLEQTHGNEIFSSVMPDHKGDNTFYLGRLLNYNSQTNPYGLLTLSFKEELLYQMIEKEDINKTVYILDHEDNIVSTRDKSNLNTNFTLATGIPLPKNNSGYEIINAGEQSFFIVYNTMPHGWKTVSVRLYQDIIAEAQKTSGQVLLISLISITLATLLIILISQYLSRRLKNIQKQTTKIENGDFSSLITDTSLDEIGLLGSAFNRMTSRLKITIDELYIKEIAKRDAELYALQSQINPHFLYNTLSVISSLAIRNGDTEVSEIVNHLSLFYRTSLNMGREYISVEKELAITKHYIAIQHMRFDNLFIEHWEIDEALYKQETLKLMLQPFIENAISHAVYQEDTPLHIYIRIYEKKRDNDTPVICFEIEDDGAGMTSERLYSILSLEQDIGYGINNVRERIQLAYGDNYGVNIQSIPLKGTCVAITIPAIIAKNSRKK